MSRLIGVFIVLLWAMGAQGQQVLTLQEAVTQALENNYQIKLAKNNIAIATENVSYGNAGMLPSVSGNFNQNNTTQNSTQTQASGEVRSLDNAKNNSMSYGVSVGWTVFDGFGMFSRLEQLKELKKQGEVELTRSLLTHITDVITTYYTLVEQVSLLQAIDSSIMISKDRLETAQNRFSIGKASKLEVLNVQVNLNTDESSRLKQQEIVQNLKITLNSLLLRNLQTDFQVVEQVVFDQEMVLEDLLADARLLNPDFMLVLIQKRIAELEVKNVKARRYPTIRLNTGYNFSESESSLGFVSSSKGRGLNYGVTASVNIFDGFNQRRNERIARIQVQNAELLVAEQELLIETSITTAYQTYLTQLQLTALEERNQSIAKQNLNITLDKYKIGSISAVEFRDAQENYISALSRFNSSRLQAKLAEIQLKELIGRIDF